MNGHYRKRPVTVQAWQFNGEDRYEWPAWVKGHPATAYELGDDMRPARLTIETLEGRVTAQLGDWIIQGVKGELYPCKPDIFDATYEPA